MTEQEALAALRGDDVAEAARAANVLWQMWHRCGDARLDGVLREGIEAMERQDLVAADATFTRLIELAPAFAEGWNKRATVPTWPASGAASGLPETLARNPHHFGALSGQGLCHIALGQFGEAAELFRRTLAVHPHLGSARNNLRAALSEIVKLN
jgi:tetratricopeptide (TPR) repeat protein